ncbi:hypothetical protein MKQ68_11145 [Chitinophaga horti]|uniref:Uncharacterized protein n=1 Tax=Chitinophaga horti TaxID=2920382 RepID=A0ABY6J7J5_9BACT|nr:hypothetical protein [Chitinophaga horti]UYQ95658.1 hypothetical protein MKQ68_11145 [Chitinophaga horti]
MRKEHISPKLQQEEGSAQPSASSGQKQRVKDAASNTSERPSRNQDIDNAPPAKKDVEKRRGMGR